MWELWGAEQRGTRHLVGGLKTRAGAATRVDGRRLAPRSGFVNAQEVNSL